ncbi:MAG: alkaline phosphatase [Bacteroidales bacterium]|nr:alkaline phosphatase [Bacteroidales bacterium]MCF6341555.1 alkaline phosphatase [Bacteroidales bacterium]
MKKTTFLLITLPLLFACNNLQMPEEPAPKKVKNIILMIGDGMGIAQVYAGMTANCGSLNLEQCQNIGLSKTYSASSYITDSGAGGTAIATGHKTYNGAIGVDKDTVPQKTILEHAEDHGKASGLIATSTITHATPASFIAHAKSRNLYEEIANDFLKTDIDVFIGGGLNNFNSRSDSIDLTQSLKANGYTLIYKTEDLKKVKSGKLAGLLYEGAPPKYSEGRGNMLTVAAEKAIEILRQNKKGFFLMIEASQIDWGGHDNKTGYVVDEMLDFDRTIGKVLEFAKADGNTLVIVTADHETGGLSLTGGDLEKGEVEAAFSTDYHTSVMVPVFAYGPGSDDFRGIYENTELFHKMMAAFGFEE